MVFLSSISLYGQSYRTFQWELEQIINQTRLRIGPFRIYPTIQLRDIGYDDNVYYQREDDGPVSDFTGTISPSFRVSLVFRNSLILSLTENPEFVFYYKQKRERRWNNTLSPGFRLLLLKRFVISGRYLNRNRRWRATREFDIRANELREGFEGSLFYETARGTSFGVTASSNKISYEDITFPGQEIYLSRRLNREERNGNFEFYYRFSSVSFFFIRGGFTEYIFEHPTSRWRDSYSYQTYAGIRFPLMGKVRGTLSLGYKKLAPRSKEKKAFTGLIGNTSLDFRIGRFNFRISYNRNIYFSYWTESIYFINDRYGAGISFYLTRFLRLDYYYLYGKSHYPELTTLRFPDGSFEELRRKDNDRTHRIGLVFRVIRNTGIGIMANFWERSSNYYFENRNRTFIGGYVTYAF